MESMRAHIVVGLAVVFGLSGCFGDPPPDPTEAPLEVVVADCVLNRPSVQVGRHEFSLVGDGSATVKAPDGTEAFRLDTSSAPSPTHELTEGQWMIECSDSQGSTGSATLRVDPAD